MLTRTLGGPARAAEKEQPNEVLRGPSGDQNRAAGRARLPSHRRIRRRRRPVANLLRGWGIRTNGTAGFDRSANHQ